MKERRLKWFELVESQEEQPMQVDMQPDTGGTQSGSSPCNTSKYTFNKNIIKENLIIFDMLRIKIVREIKCNGTGLPSGVDMSECFNLQ